MEVIVIGGGYAGLSTGALLVKKGFKVILLEKKQILGGRAMSFRDDEGFHREYGQHSHRLGEDGPAYAVFRALGEKIEFVEAEYPPGCYYKGKLYPRPDSPMKLLRSPILPFRAGIQAVRVLIKMIRSNPEQWFDKTVKEFYRRHFSPIPEVEDLLDLFSFTIMVPKADYCSAGELIDFLRRALRAKRKAGTPKGGSAQVIGKLHSIITTGGGEVRLGEKVKEIRVKDNQVEGVETDRQSYSARAVVFAAPVRELLELVSPELLPDSLVNFARNLESTSSIILEWITEEPIAQSGLILGMGVPFWAHFPTIEDPSLAPAGKHLSVFCWMMERGKGSDPEHQKESEKKLREHIENLFPKASEKVLDERKIIVPVQNGALLKPKQSRPFRPKIEETGIRGLYLAGDTVSAGGVSGDIAFSSALLVAEKISRDLSL